MGVSHRADLVSVVPRSYYPGPWKVMASILRFTSYDARCLRALAPSPLDPEALGTEEGKVSDPTGPIGIFDISTAEKAKLVNTIILGLGDEVYLDGEWRDVLLDELTYSLEEWRKRDDDLRWQRFLIDHPEIRPESDVALLNNESGPDVIEPKAVLAALKKAVKSTAYVWGKPGAVYTREVGAILWPDVRMNYGSDRGWRATRAHLRLAQVLARLVREGEAIRLRPKDTGRSGSNRWTVQGAEVAEWFHNQYRFEVGPDAR